MADEASDARAGAAALSKALQAFHRALIRAEIGDDPSLDNPYTQLFALIGDPRFAWMGVVSRLVTRIDEALADRSDPPPDLAPLLAAWREEAVALLGDGGEEAHAQFRLRHLTAIQNEPEVGIATGRLRRLLATLSSQGHPPQ